MSERVLRERVTRTKTRAYNHPLIYTALFGVVYLTWWNLLEIFMPPKYIIHSTIDDMIPFCSIFVIPYVMWFAYIGACFVYMYFKDRKEYINMATYIFTGCILALIIFTIFPTGINLRPIEPGKDIFGTLCAFIYSMDTPTNVCPSLHVFVSAAMWKIIKRNKTLGERKYIKIGAFVLTVRICLSTLFIKQHSVIDLLCGLLMAEALYPLANDFSLKKLGFIKNK